MLYGGQPQIKEEFRSGGCAFSIDLRLTLGLSISWQHSDTKFCDLE